ncbi:MAG TPA: hypothetical protein VF053_00300 [Streptosporangiales bacterium]
MADPADPAQGVERVADELYGLPAADFVATRDERAQQARARGDREAATAIRRLRRPSTSAWLANMLVRHRPDHVAELTELGDALRAAQAGLAGEDIRRLGERRRRLIDRLLPEARSLADELGHPVGEGVLREFEGTVQAVLSDADAAAAFTEGRLTTALQADAGFGFGFGFGFGVAAAPAPSSSPAAAKAPERRRQRARGDGVAKAKERDADRADRARAEVDEARSAYESAEQTAAERREAADSVAAELAAAADRLDHLLAAVDETRRAKADAERRHRVAQRRADQASHSAREAKRRLDQAERRLGDLADATDHAG